MKAKTPSAKSPSKKGKSNRSVAHSAVQQRTSKPGARNGGNAQRNRTKAAPETFISRVDARPEGKSKILPKKAKSNSISDLDGLYAAWLDEPIMQDWFELTQALDQIKDSTADEAMLPTDFLKRIRIDLATLPHCLPTVNEAWNQFCDRVGWPQEKKNAPGPDEPEHPKADIAADTDEPF